MEYTAEEVKQINKVANAWGRKILAATNSAASNNSDTGYLISVLNKTSRKEFGLVSSIGLRFPRYGIFVEMGVFGGLNLKKAVAKGKLNPKPWFNPAIDNLLPELQNALAEVNANLAVNAIKINLDIYD